MQLLRFGLSRIWTSIISRETAWKLILASTRDVIMLLITYTNTEGSDEPAHSLSFARAFTVRSNYIGN